RTVKAVYQVAKSYDVDYLLHKCDTYVVLSADFSLAEKLALADEQKNDSLFDRLTGPAWLDTPRLKELAVSADVSVQLRGKAVERHFRQLPHCLLGHNLALKKVLFSQETKDEELL
ncbi:hypothetical protein AAVH_39938, partial [Aphelenchoides avenae]